MKNRKNNIESEPVWKKRRREERIQARKTKLWIVLGVAAAVIVMGFLVYAQVRAFIGSNKSEKKETTIYRGIARVKDKLVEEKDGKTTRKIIFHIGNWDVSKDVDEATYNKLKKGEEVMLSYETDYLTGRPKDIRGWEPLQLEEPPAEPAGDNNDKKPG